jgi:hypothetical protein
MIRILSEKLDDILNAKDGPRGKGDKRSPVKVENITDLFMGRFEKENKLREDLKMLKESYTAFRQKIDYNNDLIKSIESEVQGYKKKLKSEYKSKIVFMQGLLKVGLDCR